MAGARIAGPAEAQPKVRLAWPATRPHAPPPPRSRGERAAFATATAGEGSTARRRGIQTAVRGEGQCWCGRGPGTRQATVSYAVVRDRDRPMQFSALDRPVKAAGDTESERGLGEGVRERRPRIHSHFEQCGSEWRLTPEAGLRERLPVAMPHSAAVEPERRCERNAPRPL